MNKVLSEFSSEITSDTPGAPRTDVSITKSHSGDFVVGSDRTYQLTVKNVGSLGTSGPITVRDRLPPGLTFQSFSASGWNCSTSGESITCTYADPAAPGFLLPPILITVRITEAAVPRVTNTAGVSVDADNNPANDVASAAAEVRRLSPLIFALEPPAAIAGSSGMSLKVSGSNFVPGTTLQWNGVTRQTVFLSESELQADIGAGDLASPGRNPVTVINRPGTGGISNSKDFLVYRSRCPGDANGDNIRDLLDVSRVVRHALNIQSLTAQQVTEADLDANGSVDVGDLVRLIRHLLETSRLPDCR